MLSGMETPLFLFLLLLGIYAAERLGWKYDLFMGIIGGLLFLTRPEGIIFLIVGLLIRSLITVKRHEMNLRRVMALAGSILLACIITAL
jgi:Gpi18-like mannosyltransferase